MFLPGNYLWNRANLEQLMFKETRLNEWLQICNQHFTAYVCPGWLVYKRRGGHNHEFLLFMDYQMSSLLGNKRSFILCQLVLGCNSPVPSVNTVMFHAWCSLQARGKHNISLQIINLLHSSMMEKQSYHWFNSQGF